MSSTDATEWHETSLYDLTVAVRNGLEQKYGTVFDDEELDNVATAYLVNLLHTHRAFMQAPWGSELYLEVVSATETPQA
jgi:hypothetical protein